MNDKLQFLTGVSLAFALGMVPACKNSDGDDEGAGSTTNVGTDSSSGPGPTTMNTTAVAESGDTGPMTTDATTNGSTDDGPPVCAEAELGASCAGVDPECDCASDNCFVVGPLGGVCSECDEDADCAETTGFGCNFGNPLTGVPAVCSTTGDIGESCESVDVCAKGLFCPVLIKVPAILSASTCSECEVDTDCMGGQICAPSYDIANIGGYYQCVDAGSVENDQGCNLTGDGSECVSGQCAPAAIQGIPVVGVCSPCNEDADCMGGETCSLPEVAIAGTALELVPGACM